MNDPLNPDPKVGTVASEQAASFGILRRPQLRSDRLPNGHKEIFEGGLIGRCGLNPDLARRAVTQLGDVWVVPGDGYIALVVGGMVCDRTEIAARQGMVTWTTNSGALQDLVHGLVPDGVAEVLLRAANDESTTVAVDDNVYGAVLNGRLKSAHFVGPTGVVDVGPWG